MPQTIWTITSWLLFALAFAWPAWFVARRVWRYRRYRLRCESCRYDLRDLTSDRCPECGHDISRPMRLLRIRRAVLHTMLIIALLTASHLVYRIDAIRKRGWIAAVPTTVLIACVSPDKPDPNPNPIRPDSPFLQELGYRTNLVLVGTALSLGSKGDQAARWQEWWLVHKALRLKYDPNLNVPDEQIPAVGILRAAHAADLLTPDQKKRPESQWYVHIETLPAWPLGARVTAGIAPQLAIFDDGYRITAHALMPGYEDFVVSHRSIDSLIFQWPTSFLGVAKQSEPVEYEFILERYHYPENSYMEIGRRRQVITRISDTGEPGLMPRKISAELMATLNPQVKFDAGANPQVWFDALGDPAFRAAMESMSFAIAVTVYRDGERYGSGSGVWPPPDRPGDAWDARFTPLAQAAPAWHVPIALDSAAQTEQENPNLHEWTVVIEGDPILALQDFGAASYWAGKHEFKNIPVEREERGK